MARNHPLIEDAAKGTLPKWSRVSRSRRAHMDRVAALMASWARELGLKKSERRRWKAAGLLHDSLKGAGAREMKRLLPAELQDLPVPVLHGPAAAARLAREGVNDADFLKAVAFHTLGHPEFPQIGRALYAADFLEPGRSIRPKWRARLNQRMPHDLDAVVAEIVGARIEYLVSKGRTVRLETTGLWNALHGEETWAVVSAEF